MSPESPQPGAILRGKYRVERVLGEGGMGVVFLATHLRMAQRVAIKVLRPETRDRGDLVLRFAREARAASKLRGECTVRILDVDDSEAGDPFLVMEYLEGSDLQQRLSEGGALSVETATGYVLQACEGIAEAHAVGIVHRDLKPANLFLTARPDGSPLVKVLDFGISKAIEPEAPGQLAITRPASAIGSPAYMSPEQIKDAGDVDPRTDIWALGVVLYQLLTNALPFEATSTAALAARIASEPAVPLRSQRPDIAPALEDVISRCLEKSPESRFEDIAALARALAPFATRGDSGAARIARVADAAARRSGAAPSRASPPPRPLPSSSPRPSSAAAGGAATASLHGAPPSPLARALGTEYGSAVGAAEPSGRRAPVGLAVLVALGVIGAASAAGIFLKRGPSPSPTPSPSEDAPPAPGVAAMTPVETTRPLVPVASVLPDAASPVDASPRNHRAVDRRRDGIPSKPVPDENPMDLDFR